MKTPQEQAEKIIKECARQIETCYPSDVFDETRAISVEESIKRAIPLVQLIEVARAAKSFNDKEYVLAQKDLNDALANLRNAGIDA